QSQLRPYNRAYAYRGLIASAFSLPWRSANACESYGVQFLDQTMALQRLTLRWVRSGLKLRRTYQFDYSLEGQGRRTDYLVMMGNQHVSLHLDLPEPNQLDE
ncbi:MAG: DUF3301 domain-containing protein, partial [Candidatus Thiodiazotropha sp. (ex Gloverina cf. vestifex)]|nr:DUF3301 domain-containing protein [Candidatus Thiodiazotropha sp. (ex Gloverina cf. vestifex)]